MTDFDGDGDLDVVFSESAFIGNGEGTLRVLAWNGTTLVPLWSTMMFGGITQMAWADIDGDGDNDAAFCADEQLRVYQRTGTVSGEPRDTRDRRMLVSTPP